jgi:two-component system sensor histidine kinase CiaH
MKNLFDRIPLKMVIYVYWLLLVYLIAALGWWYYELDQQNDQMLAYQQEQIHKGFGGEITLDEAQDAHDRNAKQFIGEGMTFLIFTVLGAIFVYGAVRRQIRYHLQQKNFMLAVTHELKTPIAVTKLSLETMKRHQLSEEKQQKLLGDAINETERLDMLCNNILLSSQMESGGYQSNKQEFNCAQMCRLAVGSFAKRYPNRKFEEAIPEEIICFGEEFLIRLVLNNLIENAIKYTPANTPITVTLVESNDGIEIAVADCGNGIADKDKSKVFEKFYRLEDEQIRKTKGTGLGLYLSTKIIEDHKGELSVTDNQPQGCIFKIVLPKQES